MDISTQADSARQRDTLIQRVGTAISQVRADSSFPGEQWLGLEAMVDLLIAAVGADRERRAFDAGRHTCRINGCWLFPTREILAPGVGDETDDAFAAFLASEPTR